MRKNRGIRTRWLLWSLALMLTLPAGVGLAQGQNWGGQTTFTQEDLDQLLAPIALYPDDLLAQVLTAATYPLEIVEATRWTQANPNLRGDQLAWALEQQDWDPSVKSLVNFPDILQMMNEQLDWTEMLGDAFLAEPDQVMDTVQRLRERALAQGTLQTTSELRVISDPQTGMIIIEPANPQVVYVPVYDPLIIYGPWWWPSRPPFYYHPRGVTIRTRFIGFGFGVPLSVPWGYAWGNCDWRHHRIVVNITRHITINNRIDRNRYASHVTAGTGGQGIWNHDPNHRRGIAYRTPDIARKFGRGPLPGADNRRSFRGYDRPVTGGGLVPKSTGSGMQAPRVTTGPKAGGPESFNRPTVPSERPRIVPGPGVARPEPLRQPPTPGQAPRVTTGPRAGGPESFNQPTVPSERPRVVPGPGMARPEPLRQPPTPGHPPAVTARPAPPRPEMHGQPAGLAPRAVQGSQGPTVFGGIAPGSQSRQDSLRGHESLSGPKPAGPGSTGNKPAPGGGHPGGGAAKGPQGRGK